MPKQPLLAVLLLAGCAAAQMPVPDDLAPTAPLAVEGRQGWSHQQQLRFGPFAVLGIDRSWTRGSGLQVMAYDRQKRRQSFRFTLEEHGRPRWHVDCAAHLRYGRLDGGFADVELKNRSRLDCQLTDAVTSDVWTLALEERRERPLRGALRQGTDVVTVEGTKRLAGGLPAEETSGYRLVRAGRSLAAVDVLGTGSVWLPESLAPAERSLFAGTAAALLLLEDLRTSLES